MRTGILGHPDGGYVRLLTETAARLGYRTEILRFEELAANVRDGALQIRSGSSRVDQFDAMIVRTMPPGSLEQVVSRMDLLCSLEAQGVLVVNPPKALECAVDKSLTTLRLAKVGIAVPDTIICETFEQAMDAWEELGRDVVVKPLFGSEGRGIVRVTEEELAVRVFRTLTRIGSVLYLQRFLKTSAGDIRILLLDGQLIGAIRRIPTAGEFRANLACSGAAVLHQPTDRELQLAMRAADATGSVFAGVDLMYDAADRPVVIEVNAVPGWKGLQQVCGIDVAEIFLCWLAKQVETSM